MIYAFNELTSELVASAGGKGGNLARLQQAGYPVPNGFVILPTAFAGDALTQDAWTQARARLTQLRTRGTNGSTAFAVRSSALSEDSAHASFAGEFETVLDVKSDNDVHAAIQQVRRSRYGARAQAYSQAQGLDTTHEMAIVVQQMVHAELAGVLFTADPVTGNRAVMIGNYAHGLGEQLVSGESNAQSFTLKRPHGQYDKSAIPSPLLRRHIRTLFNLAQRLEDTFGTPQDIEWAIADGKVHLLQTRPITTLQGENATTGDVNDSLRGDYLWTNSNLGEAVPDVMTPYSYSLLKIYLAEIAQLPMLGGHPFMGNIGGRFYMNFSLFASLMTSIGFSRERVRYESEEFFGHVPDGLDMPLIPFPRRKLLQVFIPFGFRAKRRVTQNQKQLPSFLAVASARATALRQRIQALQTSKELVTIWRDELEPFFRQACHMLQAATSAYENPARSLRHELRKLVGEQDTNTLMTGLSDGENTLASLGPLVGLSQVARGELSREAYAERYGHRGPHEFEVSLPRPAEDPAWIEQQLANVQDTDVAALLAKQQAQRDAAWQRLAQRYPHKAKTLQKRLAAVAAAARGREGARSEIVRACWALRVFALRAGELLNLRDAIFFLSIEELVNVLSGDKAPIAHLAARRDAHARYSALPPYPALIRGRFDPFKWAADPNRRSDLFEAHADLQGFENLEGLTTIKGYPGALGEVEGVVRVLRSVEDGNALRAGEILVTTTTNIGWTPLFPRAAAIITDVGAPLSHAAIVARELGIPAVVGCGNATMRLRTGDRVRVNGGLGTVQIV
jgi:pyruvate,water dikinase